MFLFEQYYFIKYIKTKKLIKVKIKIRFGFKAHLWKKDRSRDRHPKNSGFQYGSGRVYPPVTDPSHPSYSGMNFFKIKSFWIIFLPLIPLFNRYVLWFSWYKTFYYQKFHFYKFSKENFLSNLNKKDMILRFFRSLITNLAF